MAAKIVTDTSVLIKWFKTRDEDLLKEARALLEEVETHPLEVHVPALLLRSGCFLLMVQDKFEDLGFVLTAFISAPPYSVQLDAP